MELVSTETKVRLKAPDGSSSYDVEADGSYRRETGPVVDGVAEVTPEAARSLLRLGWTLEPPPAPSKRDVTDLEALEDAALQRVASLEAELESRRARVLDLNAAIATGKGDLAAGKLTIGEVTALQRERTEISEACAVAEEALGIAKREHREAEIRAATARLERERADHTTASRKARERADALVDVAAGSLAKFFASLQERAEIAEDVAKEFGLGPQVAPLPMAKLAERIVEKLRFVDGVNAGAMQPNVFDWILRTTAGPQAGVPLEERLRKLHISR
jgi:hypothetical protein